ncbi:MAG TPA: hypothetical protein PLD84_05080 [Chitinophagales bacterium]|nr:hypothetical protein [Chitinophagales bacterium]
MNENVSFPGVKLFESPIHPGASIGGVIPFAGKKNSWFGIHPEFGFYIHREHENGILLSVPVKYHYRFNFGLAIGGGIGIGYLHTFSNQQEYKLDNGTYKKSNSLGQPQLVVTTGIDLSYKFFTSRPHPMDVFAGYSFLVQLPYAAPVGIPLLPHTIFQIGTSWYLFQ